MTEPEYATSYEPDKAPLIYALKKKGFKGSFFDWMKEDVSHSLLIIVYRSGCLLILWCLQAERREVRSLVIDLWISTSCSSRIIIVL